MLLRMMGTQRSGMLVRFKRARNAKVKEGSSGDRRKYVDLLTYSNNE